MTTEKSNRLDLSLESLMRGNPTPKAIHFPSSRTLCSLVIYGVKAPSYAAFGYAIPPVHPKLRSIADTNPFPRFDDLMNYLYKWPSRSKWDKFFLDRNLRALLSPWGVLYYHRQTPVMSFITLYSFSWDDYSQFPKVAEQSDQCLSAVLIEELLLT